MTPISPEPWAHHDNLPRPHSLSDKKRELTDLSIVLYSLTNSRWHITSHDRESADTLRHAVVIQSITENIIIGWIVWCL